LPFWFLSSSVVYMVGAWMERWAKLRLHISGIIMMVILWTLIIG
jgi:hypothetical protein